MANVKIAVIGGGSYVFGPGVLVQAMEQHRLGDVELALADVDRSAVELMAGVGRRMAGDLGLSTRVTGHTEWGTALEGADFVICSAAVQGVRRFAMDVEVARTYCPEHVISEFGGVAGISYSLRQIALIEQLCEAMLRHCPGAWLLNVANPLPRVCQAAHECGIKTAGFCSVTLSVFGRVWKLLHGEDLGGYPWEKAQDRLAATLAGTNHFAWLLELRDQATGQDLTGEVRARIEEGQTIHSPMCERLLKETGYLPQPHDGHVGDFLAPAPGTPGGLGHEIFHGDPKERDERRCALEAMAAGTRPWTELARKVAWERPVDFIAALTEGRRVRIHALNLINDGQIPNLPKGVFVETPAVVDSSGIELPTLPLPDSVLPYSLHTAKVTDAIVRAARRRSRKFLHKAVERDPTIINKTAGVLAIEDCLRVHADLLPDYE